MWYYTANSNPSTSATLESDVSVPQKTITTPATSQKTQDAIDALLLLGTFGTQPTPNPDDNKCLMLIGGNNTAVEIALPDDDGEMPVKEPTNKPKVGTVFGVAIKSDTVDEPDTQEINDQENANDNQECTNDNDTNTSGKNTNNNNKDNKKKTFVT